VAGPDDLSSAQRELLATWLPGLRVVVDHSWGLVGTTVLEVTHGGEQYVVKAGDARDHHIGRELRAHREWLRPWTRIGRAPLLAFGDDKAKLVVTVFLPGELVLGSPAQDDPSTFAQAGELLRLLHDQAGEPDDDFERDADAKTLRCLDGPHRIAPEVEQRVRAAVTAWPTSEVRLVPTHGDWQPRNWLVHERVVSVIDFGRADLRPAMNDLSRLVSRDFSRDRALEAAFVEGYGGDPRSPGLWQRQQLREAVGTATWAFAVGDAGFEAEGHAMIADALAAL
jgi:hypothetical protein